MKKALLILAVAASVSVASAQTKPAKKTEATKKDCCKKDGASCCSPSSKAKALMTAKPSATKKG